MFRDVVTQTPFVGGAAETYFSSRIPYTGYNNDISFISTLRALVFTRMGKDETIAVHFTSSHHSAETYKSHGPEKVIRAMYDDCFYGNGDMVIHNITGTPDNITVNFINLEHSFMNAYPQFIRIDKVTDFFRNQFMCQCYVAPESKQVVIFVESLNIRKMHYLQCGIFAFLPWYFDPSVGVSEDEMELIKSLREKTSEKYLACLDKMAEKYDFRTAHITTMLKGFETRFEQIEAQKTSQNIERKLRDIRAIEDQLESLFRDKRELEIKLLGLETKISEENDESEIMEYFLCNKKLSLGYVNDNSMVFAVSDYLQYFDEDMAKTMIDNPRSYVYIPDGMACNNFIKAEDMKRLMYAIFIDQTLRIRFCSAYEFCFGEYVRPVAEYTYGSEMRECMPNPHIDRYRCIGNYERTINNCIRENDYIGALEQAIASCKSLNFGDSTVMKEFMRRMYGIDGYSKNKCVELPDGKVVTPKEAAEWLKEQEGGQEVAQETQIQEENNE